jgi:hypothetical protein
MCVYNTIKDWIKSCIDSNSFCPEDSDKPFNPQNNVKCYITSPGTEAGNVDDTRGCR